MAFLDRRAQGVPSRARPLFVAGSPRSGTTGLIAYLNRHPEILVCRERYKYGSPRRITPDLFAFERILDFRDRETNQSRDAHVELLGRKDPASLKWVGDKYPLYFKSLRELAKKNRGARFIMLYRPVEEVAESFEARASNPNDGWPERNGFEAGIRVWNESLRHTRAFVESKRNPRLLIVDYHRFFGASETFIPLLSGFLGVHFDDHIRTAWASMSNRFAETRRTKAAIGPEHERLVRETKDHAAEAWMLERIASQGSGGVTSSASGLRRARRMVSSRLALARR